VPGDYLTIQQGINAAVDGDTVLVADGVYTGLGNKDIEYQGKAIVVKSENGPELTIIDCEEWGRGFKFIWDETELSVLDGFTISNGYLFVGEGGGIYCYEASPVIKNCFLLDNYARSGGGISCDNYSSATIINCVISGNSSYNDGGGILCDVYSDPTITSCLISGNSSGWGGGICSYYYSHPTVTGCIISGNSASYEGGGIYSIHSDMVVKNCLLEGNTAINGGGGFNVLLGSPEIENCTFTGNTTGGSGGGIRTEVGGYPVVTNCILWADSPNEIYILSGGVTVSYSNVQGSWPGEGNINNDPLFTEFHQLRYFLDPASPCVDTGDPATEDFLYDWHSRWPEWFPNGARSDMGAYGGPGNAVWIKLFR